MSATPPQGVRSRVFAKQPTTGFVMETVVHTAHNRTLLCFKRCIRSQGKSLVGKIQWVSQLGRD